ncbi:hypothetical protein FACS1894102_7630 [Spirochaetia bacterium]|nr:hypothetical protein FACS1894102_7630 [Spirochaetia bacterium]
MNKKYYLEQLGCAKNQVEGETLLLHLNAAGYVQTNEASEADFIIVNSCGFIEAAKKESINTVITFKKLYPKATIILCGCLAMRYENDLKKSMSEADIIFAGKDLCKIVDILNDHAANNAASNNNTPFKSAFFFSAPIAAPEESAAYTSAFTVRKIFIVNPPL